MDTDSNLHSVFSSFHTLQIQLYLLCSHSSQALHMLHKDRERAPEEQSIFQSHREWTF